MGPLDIEILMILDEDSLRLGLPASEFVPTLMHLLSANEKRAFYAAMNHLRALSRCGYVACIDKSKPRRFYLTQLGKTLLRSARDESWQRALAVQREAIEGGVA